MPAAINVAVLDRWGDAEVGEQALGAQWVAGRWAQ